MPFDDMAADEQSRALQCRSALYGGQLLYLPQHRFVDHGDLRSRHDWVGADGLTPARACGQSCGLHGLPCRQQLHVHRRQYGLLWLPPDGLAEHDDDRRKCAKPHYRRVFDIHVFDMPRHGFVVRRKV